MSSSAAFSSWPTLRHEDAMADIRSMLKETLSASKRTLSTDTSDDGAAEKTKVGDVSEKTNEQEYKMYLNMFLGLRERANLRDQFAQSISVVRLDTMNAQAELNVIKYRLDATNESSVSAIVQHSSKLRETAYRLRKKLQRAYDNLDVSDNDETSTSEIVSSFRNAITPQLFTLALKDAPRTFRLRPLRRAHAFCASLSGAFSENEDFRANLRRLLGSTFFLSGRRIQTKTLRHAVDDVNEEISHLLTSSCSSTSSNLYKEGRDNLCRMLLRSAEHSVAGSIIVDEIGAVMFPDESEGTRGAMASSVAMIIPVTKAHVDSDDEKQTSDTCTRPRIDIDVGPFPVSCTPLANDVAIPSGHIVGDAGVRSTSPSPSLSSSSNNENTENERIRAEAIETMRREEVKRMRDWLSVQFPMHWDRCRRPRSGAQDQEDDSRPRPPRTDGELSLVAYIEATEDRVRKKGHRAEDFIRENDEAWGLRESWREAVESHLMSSRSDKMEEASWCWGVRGRVRVEMRFKVFPNDTIYISQNKKPWCIVAAELDVHLGMPVLSRGLSGDVHEISSSVNVSILDE